MCYFSSLFKLNINKNYKFWQTLCFGLNVIILNNNTVNKAIFKSALFLRTGGLAFSCYNDNADSNVIKKKLVQNYAHIA
jgi:hypothetical protein